VSQIERETTLEPATVSAPTAPPLAGKVALVTGGGRGMGRGFALRLGWLGASVAVVDLDLAGAVQAGEARSDVLAELEARETTAIGFEVDVGHRAAVDGIVDETLHRLGALDVLICAAGTMGVLEGSAASSASAEAFESIFATNLSGTVNCCQAAAPALKAGGWGKVVNVSSLAALRPSGSGLFAAYVAAKSAVIGYTLSLAEQLGPDGVTVNAIAPGVFPTDLNRALLDSPRGQEFLARIPMHRFGKLDELVGAAIFLASDAASYLTGQLLVVDGGLLASGVNQ
jgi:NAD(P)-dependent dehydrogenase (short-subunit alcohol dehydrogenase family)